MAISNEDLQRLRRCVELARSALDAGDEPFGSILVDGDGTTRYEDRTHIVPIGSLRPGMRAAVEGTIELAEVVFRGRRSLRHGPGW